MTSIRSSLATTGRSLPWKGRLVRCRSRTRTRAPRRPLAPGSARACPTGRLPAHRAQSAPGCKDRGGTGRQARPRLQVAVMPLAPGRESSVRACRLCRCTPSGAGAAHGRGGPAQPQVGVGHSHWPSCPLATRGVVAAGQTSAWGTLTGRPVHCAAVVDGESRCEVCQVGGRRDRERRPRRRPNAGGTDCKCVDCHTRSGSGLDAGRTPARPGSGPSAKVNRRAAGRTPKPAIASGCDPTPFRTWKSNLASLSCY